MLQTQEISDTEAKDMKKAKVKVADAPMEPMTIKVDGALKDYIAAVADQDGKTPSEVAREILEKSLSGNPDRRRAALLRSLAVTKAQIEAASKREESFPWFRQRRFSKAISAIADLEDFLKEPSEKPSDGIIRIR